MMVEALQPLHGTGAASHAAFGARKHEVKTGRSAKGAATQKVTRRGTAYVIGSWTHDEHGAAGWSGALAVAIEQHAGRFGAREREILEVTNRLFGDEIEPLLGTEATSWEEVVNSGFYGRPIADDDDRYWNPEGYTASADVVSAHTWQDIDQDHNLRGTNPPETAKHVTRQRIGLSRSHRKDDPTHRATASCLRAVCEPYTAPVLATALRWELVAPTDDQDTRFVGHRKVTRPAVKVRRGTRRARTTANVTSAAQLVEHVNAMQPGGRVTFAIPGGSGSVTLGHSGRYSLTAHTLTGETVKDRARSTTTIAARIAAMT